MTMPKDVLVTAAGLVAFWFCLCCFIARLLLSTILTYLGPIMPSPLWRALSSLLKIIQVPGRLSSLSVAMILFAAIMCLQVLLGTPIPVAYVAGDGLCHQEPRYCDGDAVILSGHGSFGVGSTVLLRTNSSSPLYPTKLPKSDFAAASQLRLRRVFSVRQKENSEWDLQIGIDFQSQNELIWIDGNDVISAVYIRIPIIATFIRCFHRGLGEINTYLGVRTTMKRIELHKHLEHYFSSSSSSSSPLSETFEKEEI